MITPENNYILSVIIVSYNTKTLLKICIDSIINHLTNIIKFEIIIVDNNSSDGSINVLKDYSQKHTNIRVEYLQENTGFSRANTIGIECSSAPLVLLLNSDTYLIDASLKNAVSYLLNKPTLFGLGCMLLTERLLPGVSYGKFPGLKTVLYEVVFDRFSKSRGIVPAEIEGIHSIDFPCGAFYLINRDAYNKTGGFDNAFFMYFEETDLSKRAWKTGYEIEYYPHTRIVHLGGGSGAFSFNAKKIFYESWNRYLKKHVSAENRFFTKWLLYAYFFIQLAKGCIKFRKKSILDNWMDIRAIYTGWH